jgi:hypothetical protein
MSRANNQNSDLVTSNNYTSLLLDIILTGRTHKLVSIIYIDNKGNTVLTEPSNKHIIPPLSNCPDLWYIPTTNLTQPKSLNLSVIEISFTIKKEGTEVWAVASKEKDLKKLDIFLRYQNDLQNFLGKNSKIRNDIFDKVALKGWDYSKHIPWSQIKIIENKEKNRQTFFLRKSFPMVDNQQPVISIQSSSIQTDTPMDIQEIEPTGTPPISIQKISMETSKYDNPEMSQLDHQTITDQSKENNLGNHKSKTLTTNTIDLDFPIPENINMGTTLGTPDHQEIIQDTMDPESSNDHNKSSLLSEDRNILPMSRSISPVPNSLSLVDIRINERPPGSNNTKNNKKGKGKAIEAMPSKEKNKTTEKTTNRAWKNQSSFTQTTKTKEEAASKRLLDYETQLLNKEWDNIDSLMEEDSFDTPLTEISEQSLITKWASKLSFARKDAKEMRKLLLEINNTPKGRLQQKPLMNIFIKIEARDRRFFPFVKTSDLKQDHQLEYEQLERKFHDNYKRYHKIGQLNREVREKIRSMINSSILIAYLRFIKLSDLDAYLLAQILEFGCNYLCRSPKQEKIDYSNLLQECKGLFQDILPPLPDNFTDVHPSLRTKISFSLPIRDRSTTISAVRALRHYYSFTHLPDSYFVFLPSLPEDPNDLPKDLGHLFPICERKLLKTLGTRVKELKKQFVVPQKLPASYFNLPPPKISLPPSYNLLDEEFSHFFPLDTSIHKVGDVVRDLRKKYFFKHLPDDYFKGKRPLPRDPAFVESLSEHNITIPTTNHEDTQRLIKILEQEFNLFLPLGPQWVSPKIKQTNKPDLPSRIQEADPSLKLGQFLIKDGNLNVIIKALHNFYEFQRIPDSWFETPRIPLPDNMDTINQILKSKGMYTQVPLEDNDLLIPGIKELRKVFMFTRLPEEFIFKESLPDPEFDLAPSFC